MLGRLCPARIRLAAVLVTAAVYAVALVAAVPSAQAASSPLRARPATASTVQALVTPPLPGITSLGTSLLLNGRPHVFAGVNAYELGTWWDVNPGCGGEVDKLGSLFGALPTHSLVRFWAFQSLAVNKHTHTWDFTALDRVFRAAAAHGDYLIATLSDQAGTCDGDYWHNDAWYKGGYRHVRESDGEHRNITSFAGWVNKVVPRYRSNRGLGMWELVNEPEPSNCATGYVGYHCQGHTQCPTDATTTLRSFFDVMGARLHSLDARHPVAAGLVGRGQCGSAGRAYRRLGRSAGVDVLTYHDYGQAVQPPLPADLKAALAAARADGKPLLTEEAGVSATALPTIGCDWNLVRRAATMSTAFAAQRAAGIAGYLPWDWTPQANATCSTDIGPGDPLLRALG